MDDILEDDLEEAFDIIANYILMQRVQGSSMGTAKAEVYSRIDDAFEDRRQAYNTMLTKLNNALKDAH